MTLTEIERIGVPVELDCGIQNARIATWLDEEIALARFDGRWVFEDGGHTCTIELSRLENRVLGKLDLERTLVKIEGNQQAIDVFYRMFTLRFISAGG